LTPPRLDPRLHRSGPLHALAWVAWTAASVVALSLTRNPLYLLLLLLCLGLVLQAARRAPDAPPLPLSPLRFALLVVTISALFNALTAHFGQTVLFTLPERLPLLGGPVTLEALVYGVLNGLVLTGFFVAWTALFVAVPTQALIRLIPRAFYPAGVVLSIALAFVPTTFAQFQQIREAQMMRGHRVRGLRDWLPLLMPLLVGGLERAFQLAEAMTARGFGSLGVSERSGLDPLRVALVAGLTTLLAGLLVLLFWQQEVAGWSLVALGGGALLMALRRQGQRVQRTVYRRQFWTGSDGLVIAAAALTVGVYLLPASRGALAWSPYPQLTWPGADPVTVLATLGLLTPGVLLARPQVTGWISRTKMGHR
jgi:energy-coupling factor transport system permease protein